MGDWKDVSQGKVCATSCRCQQPFIEAVVAPKDVHAHSPSTDDADSSRVECGVLGHASERRAPTREHVSRMYSSPASWERDPPSDLTSSQSVGNVPVRTEKCLAHHGKLPGGGAGDITPAAGNTGEIMIDRLQTFWGRSACRNGIRTIGPSRCAARTALAFQPCLCVQPCNRRFLGVAVTRAWRLRRLVFE